MLQSKGVVRLELDQLSLICRQKDTRHESRDTQLFDHLKQIDLHIQLLQSLSEQAILFSHCQFALPLQDPPSSRTATLTTAREAQATADLSENALDLRTEALCPRVPKHMPRHYSLTELLLLLVVGVVLTGVEIMTLVFSGLFPGEYLLEQ